MSATGSRSAQSKGGSRSSGSEQNDLKQLKSKYGSKLATLKELFVDWTDDDLLFAIQDADGDLELAVDRISEGKRFNNLAEEGCGLTFSRTRLPVGPSAK